jgi:hypothetical protein
MADISVKGVEIRCGMIVLLLVVGGKSSKCTGRRLTPRHAAVSFDRAFA